MGSAIAMDTVSKNKRSEIMRAVKSKDTKLEIAFRKSLSAKGLRYLRNSGKYFGKPDIIFKKYKIAIFIDSCFWHGCKKHCRIPSTNKTYWIKKIKRNKDRDKKVNRYYQKLGWKLYRIWEHNLKQVISKPTKKLIRKFTSYMV